MATYSPFIDAILLHSDELLRNLKARGVTLPARVREIREADAAQLAGDARVLNEEKLSLVHAALLYAVDDLDHAHRLAQESRSDTAAYWHGMIHRREGDFENARYWFRRAGHHPAFIELHRRGSNLSADMARQIDWDPYLFTGECEQAAFGAPNQTLVPLQKMEFEVMLDYTWRQAVEA